MPKEDLSYPGSRPAVPDAAREDEDFEDLLEAGRRGEPAALRDLFTRFSRPVASYLRARGVRDVDDITSEVFLAVFTGLGRFRGGEKEFVAWVLTITHHRWVDEQRRAGRRVPTTGYVPETDPRRSDSAEATGLQRLSTERVREQLDQLSPDQRDVLLLRLIDDLTIEQVGTILGKRVGAVKALQRRGLAALRRAIDEEGVPL